MGKTPNYKNKVEKHLTSRWGAEYKIKAYQQTSYASTNWGKRYFKYQLIITNLMIPSATIEDLDDEGESNDLVIESDADESKNPELMDGPDV